MSLNLNQILTMLGLQDSLNSKVNENWREAGCDWLCAIGVESVELLEHYGWKWWKHQETNLAQCRLELVDIWHFILSQTIVECGPLASLQEVGTFLHSKYTRPGVTSVMFENRCYRLESTSTKELIQVMAGKAFAGDFSFHLFRELAKRVGLTDELLYGLYIGKNVLNVFRTKHGYKQGTYVKNWFDLEDNDIMMEHLTSLLNEGSAQLAEDLMQRLEITYQDVLAGK